MTDRIESPPDGSAPEPANGGGGSGWFGRITGAGSRIGPALLMPSLAFLAALVVGAIIIAATDLDALDRFGSEPFAALGDMASGVGTAYKALLEGAFGSVRGISETLFAATPLILTGLAVALGFRAGLFNIGARGQMIIGGAAALWVWHPCEPACHRPRASGPVGRDCWRRCLGWHRRLSASENRGA